MRRLLFLISIVFFILSWSFPAAAWFDETHVTIAKAAGYSKWFSAAGPDMVKKKMFNREGHNHFVNNPRGTTMPPEKFPAQMRKYNKGKKHGHLYKAWNREIPYFKE